VVKAVERRACGAREVVAALFVKREGFYEVLIKVECG